MNDDILLLTCLIIEVINVFMMCRNWWVFDRQTELNRFENGKHLITLYLSYDEMMNRWWVWDIEKLKVPNAELPGAARRRLNERRY